jgi:hypothetical protein
MPSDTTSVDNQDEANHNDTLTDSALILLQHVLPQPFYHPPHHPRRDLMPRILVDLELHALTHAVCLECFDELDRAALARRNKRVLTARDCEDTLPGIELGRVIAWVTRSYERIE